MEFIEVYKTKLDIGDKTKSFSRLEKPYAIEINFRNLNEEDRKKRNNLPTSFKLEIEQLDLIDRVVPVFVKEKPGIKRLKENLNQNSG
jgi:hypothetical protein